MTAPLVLHGYVALGPFPDMSPFVTKVESYLRLAQLSYEKRLTMPPKVPRAKLPYLEQGAQGVPDSGEILAYLAREGLADLDASLEDGQRAELAALRSMLELELYFIIAYFRWQDDGGWLRYRPVVCEFLGASGVPGFLHGLASAYFRRAFVSSLHAQGVGRRERDENLSRARELFFALEHFLARRGDEGGPWWFGAQPSSADAIAHAFVGHSTKVGLGTPLEQLLDDCPTLARWYTHVDAQITGT